MSICSVRIVGLRLYWFLFIVDTCFRKDEFGDCLPKNQYNNNTSNDDISDTVAQEDNADNEKYSFKPPLFQKGVLRTNCIDCLDRTNVAQYCYGLAALGHQLHELGYINVKTIGLDDPLADELMRFYETMGDTLALQYGGSAAHNKVWLKYDLVKILICNSVMDTCHLSHSIMVCNYQQAKLALMARLGSKLKLMIVLVLSCKERVKGGRVTEREVLLF